MKILFLLTQDLGSPSGLGRYFPLAKELARLGHQVTIAALHPDYDALDKKEFRMDDVLVNYVAPMHVKKVGSHKEYYSFLKLMVVIFRATWKLTSFALKSNADLIHIGKPHPMNSIAGLMAKFFKHPVVFLDCDDDETGSNRFSGKWQRYVMSIFERNVPKWVDLVTSNTYGTIERMRQMGVPTNRLYYIPNGVEHRRFVLTSTNEIDVLRGKLNLGVGPVVAYIGSISLVNHPIQLLLKAFTLVKQQHEDAILLIVGGGEDLETVQSLCQEMAIEKSTRVIGRVPPDQVVRYYQIATVMVDPVFDDRASRGRAPLKMFESWATGVPFVSARVGDRALLAGDPPAAVLVEPGSDSKLAAALNRVIENAKLRDELRNLGFHRVKEFYWERIAERCQEIYQLPKDK